VFVQQLTPYLGKAQANTIVWTTIWLIPGVFGFLVWELKENWRLYAANRPRALRAVPIGHHGETMVRLLRPGFHSGTLPKLFASVRRAVRKAEHTGNWKPVNHKCAAVRQVEEAIRRFVQRELLGLLDEAGFSPGASLSVGLTRVATNRVEVELCRSDKPGQSAWLAWEEEAGRLSAATIRAGWIESLSSRDRDRLAAALTGLFQRSGADKAPGPLAGPASPPITWERWVTQWSAAAAPSPSTAKIPAPSASRAG
jgi:hypothetical protein